MSNAEIVPGSVVTARPWVSGDELRPQRAIVFVPNFNDAGEYALLWFPRLGDPYGAPPVQAIRLDKITEVRDLVNESPWFVLRAYQACKRVNLGGQWRKEWRPAGFAIESADRVASVERARRTEKARP